MKHFSLFLLFGLLACGSHQRVDQAPAPVPQPAAPQPAPVPQASAAPELAKPLPVLGDPYGLLSKPAKPTATPKVKETTVPAAKPKETIDPGALIGEARVDNLALPSRPNRAAHHHRKKGRRK